MNETDYGEKIKQLRIKTGLTQRQIADALNATPGYISNVENGRTAMSLRMLIYYARLLNVSLDYLVGEIAEDYKPSSLDNAILKEVSLMNDDNKEKLLETLKIWNKKS
ncbi:MAG: helix-turn-helix transcriptional regulator [Lachnospiraceae bacterium]|nr:helix-turn-helix transcriptional regulator [Lachnospiraceae bacterium]